MWRLYTFDLWGNPVDGFDVNEVHKTIRTWSRLRSALADLKKEGCVEDRNDGDGSVFLNCKEHGHPVCHLEREKKLAAVK